MNKRIIFSLSLIGFFIVFSGFAVLAKHTVPADEESSSNAVQDEPFSDVSENHRNFEAIEALRTRGLVSGYSNGTFKPGKFVTRAEAAAMIVRARDPENPHPDAGRYKNCFDDTEKQWFAKYACLGKSERWLKGYPGTQLFRPGSSVIVVELLRMAIDAFKIPPQAPITLYKIQWDIPKGYKNEPRNFPVMEWWEIYMVTARYYNYIDQTPYAAKMMSRGEVAEILYRIMQQQNLI